MGGTYDAIVAGLGAMGSAAAYHLAKRGRRVLGLEAFAAGHALGSSAGESRFIRLAYFEHPDYVPLLRRAYALWESLEAEAGEPLLRKTGGLFIGPPDGALVAGSLRSAREHGLAHELLDAAEIRWRHPALQARDGEVALFERPAGFLSPERCVAAHLRLAAAAGAEIRHDEPVRGWSASGAGVEVVTDAGRYRADRLVLTAGAWLSRLLPGLGLPLAPERVVMFWLEPRERADEFGLGRFPVWLWDAGALGLFYGFPHVAWPGVKVARHHSGEACDPDTVRRSVDAADEAPVRAFLRRHIPALDGPLAAAKACMYVNTPDEHFVVDRHPGLPQVVYGGGFSGHGFKFASVIGEILADLAIDRRTTPEADFLRADRFAPPTR